MPGLPKEPQALHIDIVDGEIEGLSWFLLFHLVYFCTQSSNINPRLSTSDSLGRRGWLYIESSVPVCWPCLIHCTIEVAAFRKSIVRISISLFVVRKHLFEQIVCLILLINKKEKPVFFTESRLIKFKRNSLWNVEHKCC